jgi:hypothetical protein
MAKDAIPTGHRMRSDVKFKDGRALVSLSITLPIPHEPTRGRDMPAVTHSHAAIDQIEALLPVRCRN